MNHLPLGLLRCPRCLADLPDPRSCATCGEFPQAGGQPVLIDFENSILDSKAFDARDGASAIKRRGRLHDLLVRFVEGVNRSAEMAAGRMVEELGPSGVVLVIGGGAMGSGAKALYEGLIVVGTDIYPTEITQIVADGHNLPFKDQSFDGVWIQAVLEHVLSPEVVVAEIYRVLKPRGLVFADTPFMQPVHEAAYDFTRFSLSGQRWLFRDFDLVECGATGGAGTSLIWAIRYFVRALSGSKKLGRLATLAVFWLRFFDGKSRAHADAASGTYLLGRKSDVQIRPRQMVDFYATSVAGAQA